MRYRACLDDLSKHPLFASDSFVDRKVSDLALWEVWDWVDKVLGNLRPRKGFVKSLIAVVYPSKQLKSERRQKTIRRDDYSVWEEFSELAKRVDFRTSDELNIDFDVVLSELRETSTQPATPTVQRYSPPITATIIQEHVLAGVLDVERVATGKLLALRDRWRCTKPHCNNIGKQCRGVAAGQSRCTL